MNTYIKQNKMLFALTVLASILASLGYVFIALLLQQLLDIAIKQDLHQFLQIVLFSIGYFILLGFFLYLQSLLSKKVICKILQQIRTDIFRGIVNHNMEDFSKKNTADYISIVTNDVKMIEDNYLLPLFEIVQYVVIFISSFFLMIYFDFIVTICVIIAIAIMMLVPALLGKPLEQRQNRFSTQLSRFTVVLKDILSGFEIVKSYSMKKSVTHRFHTINTETIDAKYSVDKLMALNEGLSAFLALLVQIVVLFLSAYFIISGRITAGTLLGMVQVSSNLANPLIMIFTNVPKIKSVHPIVDKIQSIAKYSDEQTGKSAAFNHQICAKNVSFSYDCKIKALTHTNCTIEKGKKYVILGKSGCGKSTLIKLLSGYYSTYTGEILYDHQELHTIKNEQLVQLSSIIHQNIYMFNESIYDNICLHESFSENQITAALEKSGLTDFIATLPDGLHHQVGENGANLSGGQKQRIAVARALIRNKPILILDEGTSAIDRQTAYDIENRLLKMNGLTLITITHHLEKELLNQYDEIFFMENGQINEHGNFETLITTAPRFADYLQVTE